MNSEASSVDWKKVKDTFHEALRLPPSDRDKFLNEACKGDIDLRIEIESLLLSLNEAKSFLEEPPGLLSSERDVAWQFQNGELVSHYRIVEAIGVGGMGQVYLAEDQKLHRQVALKVLPAEVLEDGDRLRRFKREALAVSALNHPNILTIFEFDDIHGVPLLASEYVRGGTLRDRLRRGQLDVDATIEIALQVASALQTAHAAGVIHRDIKPENIMIRDDGYVKVLDFGLAKLTGDMRAKETDRTHTQAFSLPGMIMGTATYMSPEQARSRSVDTRTDIFSFGIVLYEMLTGKVPFSGDTTADIIAEIIQKDPASPARYDASVPDELCRITLKCLEKERSNRYQTAGELFADLKTFSKPAEVVGPAPEAETSPPPDEKVLGKAAAGLRENSNAAYPAPLRVVMLVSVILILSIIAASYWYLSR